MGLTKEDFIIREINSTDNIALARVIRQSLEEFGAAKPGTVYFDPTTDELSKVFENTESAYFVVTHGNEIAGGGGIFPTKGLPENTCELVKLYLAPQARGIGMGKMLMQLCEDKAAQLGYATIYLETMPELTIAIPLYEKMGYKFLDSALGNSGHTGCSVWMLKEIDKKRTG